METSVHTIRRINVMSALKIGAIATTLIWAVLGLVFVLFSICFSGLAASTSSYYGNTGGVFAGGVVGAIFVYIIGLVLYGIIGAVVSALYAWIYNLTAGWVGGLEIELTEGPGVVRTQMPTTAPRY